MIFYQGKFNFLIIIQQNPLQRENFYNDGLVDDNGMEHTKKDAANERLFINQQLSAIQNFNRRHDTYSASISVASSLKITGRRPSLQLQIATPGTFIH